MLMRNSRIPNLAQDGRTKGIFYLDTVYIFSYWEVWLGVYKVSHSPPLRGGGVIKSFWEEFQVVKMGR